MRKCKFITGTMSLTLAMVVGITSFAQISGNVEKDIVVAEYETTTSEVSVERSANEVNVLMDAGIARDVTNVSLELETPVSMLESITITEEETTVSKDSETESESKEKKKETKKKKSKSKKKQTKKKESKSKTTKNNKLKKLGTYKITAYCGCSRCCGKSTGITASGTKAKAGRTIAADTSVLPFGTKVIINGKEYTVEDRGGSIRGNRIDVYFNSHSEALKWGVKYIDVYVKK